MAINFPNSPTLNQIAQVGSNYYIWNGSSWVGYTTSFTVNYNASSISLESNDSAVGATTSLNFDSTFSVAYNSGIATVSVIGGGGGSSNWTTTSDGIYRLSNVGIGTTADSSDLVIGGSPDKLTVLGSVRSWGAFNPLTGFENGFSVGSNRDIIKGIFSYDDGNGPSGISEKGVKITAINESLSLSGGINVNYNEIVINENGVGIGTALPSSKLTVDGNAHISGIVTASYFSSTLGAGTPNITSPNNLNLNANIVAISTDLSVNRNATIDGDLYLQGGVLGINTNSKLTLNGPTVNATPDGYYNVMDYGAAANGVTNDTNAFNSAIVAAGDGGSVYAPPGNYKVNGILVNKLNQNIDIQGTLIIGANQSALIFDRTGQDSSTQNCNVFVKEIRHSGTTQRPSDNSIGVYFKNGSFNTIKFERIGFLHYGFKLEPGSISPQGLTSDNRLVGNLIEWCRIGVWSAGGTSADNHTEHTIVEVNFIAHYQYGIYKTNSIGSQKFWYVNTAFDAFPGSNPDYAADVYDNYVQADDENLNACWYQAFFSTDFNNAFQGNAFTSGRNCYLFDICRRKAHFGRTVKFDTYLGTLELTGPVGSATAGGLILTSANGNRYRLQVSNTGALSTVLVT